MHILIGAELVRKRVVLVLEQVRDVYKDQALVLAELLPDKASDILKVGYEYGTSRVIVGFHYQTDVQAARTAASGSVAVLHSDKEFQKDMKKAKKELAKLGLR